MGMADDLSKRWLIVNNRYLGAIRTVSDATGGYGSVAKDCGCSCSR